LDGAITKGFVMPQEFYGSFQDNIEKKEANSFSTDEGAGRVVDYVHPEYYQLSEFVPCEQPASPNYNDYTHPSYYSSSPYSGSETQESLVPVAVEWKSGDEERGGTGERQQEEVGSRQASSGGRVRRLVGLGGVLATIGGWLLKLKGLAFLLKFGATGFMALISVAFYSLAFGWVLAFGFVGLIFVHEMGHVIAVKAKGLPVRGMLFIPFFGAAVLWSDAKNIQDEAEVAIAGPLAGAIGASICLGIAELFHLEHTVWLPLAYIGFFLNLLNLAPVWPLDGGRIFDAINRRISIIGFVGLLGLQIWFWLHGNPSLWLLFLLILSGSRFFGQKQASENAAYYKISTASRVTLTILYFALAIVLFLGMTVAQSYMHLPVNN
jgi:Zn-dependent protease